MRLYQIFLFLHHFAGQRHCGDLGHLTFAPFGVVGRDLVVTQVFVSGNLRDCRAKKAAQARGVRVHWVDVR